MDTFSHVPPGFRFHPTDEELVDYYLRKKIASRRIDLDVIKDVDLYKIEPWDLQELCKIGNEEQNEWYFFSHKDKKYPTGTRTNRATKAGFWKATGRDKAIYSNHSLVGMRKTLVFYKGRAPNGQKSDWIMHEYRLETNENGSANQEEGWVVCRVFIKRITTTRKMGEHDSLFWYDDQVSFMPDFDSPRQNMSYPYTSSHHHHHHHQYYSSCKQELDQLQHNVNMPPHQNPSNFLQLPQLESPNNGSMVHSSTLTQEEPIKQQSNIDSSMDQLTDWRVLDKFVASQFSHEEDAINTKEDIIQNYSSSASFQVAEHMNMLLNGTSERQDDDGSEYASMSTPTCPIDLWK